MMMVMHKKRNGRTALRAGRRGFTLVELVIVGALIALFSSLAVFGVQQQFRSNIRKAAIGETRQISQALDFANLDTSVFPKLCWLTESRDGMALLSEQILPGAPNLAFGFLDINSRQVDGDTARGLAARWDGPYFALSQSRAGVAQGRGGFVYMLFPDMPAQGPNSLTGGTEGIRWPADPYNNPYVVYMLDINRPTTGGGTSQLVFVNGSNEATAGSATMKGDFVNAVVSYGPNHYPGGDEYDRGDLGVVPGGDAAAVAHPGTANIADGFGYRLYKGSVNYTPAGRGLATYTYLTNAEFTAARASIWSRDFHGRNDVIGITDPGSDDIVFEF